MMDSAMLKQYEEQGYIGPFKLFDAKDGETLLKEFSFPNDILTWYKSIHEKSDPVVKWAKSKPVLDQLIPILGNDILLWGTSFIEQPPGKSHGWHLDVEHGKWDGATIWLGVKNLSQETTVSLITHSQKIPSAPQELKRTIGLNDFSDEQVLAAAKTFEPNCELVTLRLKAGEFIIWSGRVWHTTHNHSDKTRFALILQFCTPKNKTFVPVTYTYPDTQWGSVRPPCVLIHGKDEFQLNALIPKKSVATLALHRGQRFYYGMKKIMRPYKIKVKSYFNRA
jgi:non-heme Fe2+,alpha-ketoglutarate-dependent halogenase